MHPRFRLLTAAGLAVFAVLAALPGAAQTRSLDDLVLADVYGEPITRRQLVTRLLDYNGEQALEKMINRAIMFQESARRKVTVTDEEVQSRLADLQGKFKTEQDFRAFLAQTRLKEDQLRDNLHNTALIQKLALKDSPVTDEDLQQYDAQMIVAPDKAAAEKLIKDLDGGASFRQLAVERNEDTALRDVAGRLKPFLRMEMLDVSRAIEEQKLAPGTYTRKPVLLTNNLWVIIRLEKIDPVSRASASERDRLVAAVTAFRVDQWINQTRTKARVEKKSLNEPVVATVNGEPIQRTQLVARLLEYHGEESLELLINRTLLLQSSKRQSVAVSEAEADQELARVRARFKTPDDYQAFLTRSNVSEKQFRDELRYTLLMQRVALKESPITETDLQRYEVRMLAAPDRSTAEKWVKDLDNGADFIKLVVERSVDAGGRQSGGRMRPFVKVELLDIWRAIDEQKLKPGGYTKKPVLLTDGSWVLIKLENILPVSKATPAARERMTTTITNYRIGQWLNQTLAAARSAGKIARPVPLTSAVIRGPTM